MYNNRHPLYLISCLLLWLGPLADLYAGDPPLIHTWEMLEISLEAEKEYALPYLCVLYHYFISVVGA